MKKCTQCGTEGSGKFCGKCGASLPALSSQTNPESTQPIPQRVVPRSNPQQLRGAKLIWSLEPQVVAQKLSEDSMANLSGAHGIVIREGTRALIFADGKLLGEFTQGEYQFRDALVGSAPVSGSQATVRVGGLMGSIRGLAQWTGQMLLGEQVTAEEARRRAAEAEARKGGSPLADQPEMQGMAENFVTAVHSKKTIAVVLARADDFHLVFTYPQLQAADLKTDLGVDLLMRVKDLTDFYRDFLMDTRVLTSDGLAKRLGPILTLQASEAVRGVRVEELENNRALMGALETGLNQELSRTIPSVTVSRVFKLTAKREELDRLNQIKEKLYLSERELTALQAQNEFANRLRVVEGAQQASEARSNLDIEKQLRTINQDKLLSDEQFAQWLERVKLDRDLASARTQDERGTALQEFRKRNLLRTEELQILESQSQMQLGHTLGLLELRQQLESRRLELEIEGELAPKQLDLELARHRRELTAQLEFSDLAGQQQIKLLEQELAQLGLRDDYADQRRGRDRGHRREDLDLDQLEQLKQLEVAQRAQALAQATRQQEHERDLAQLREVKRAEKEMLEAEAQRWSGMSVEQIMAANPKLTPEAARALAERASSVKAEEFAKMESQSAQKSKDEFKEALRQQMEAQERMMRVMMESNAAIAGAQLRNKESEIDRANTSADRSEDRLSRVVSSTVGAVAGKHAVSAVKTKFCTHCGDSIGLDSVFCQKCGAKQ